MEQQNKEMEISFMIMEMYEKRGISTSDYPFVAMDEGGLFCAYTHEPIAGELSWCNTSSGGKVITMGKIPYNLRCTDWRDSLMKWNPDWVPEKKQTVLSIPEIAIARIVYKNEHMIITYNE